MMDHADILDQYTRMRQLGRVLNNSLMGCLSKDAVKTIAKRLGVLRKGTIVCDEDELPVLFDQAIYDDWHNGKNAVDRYLATNPPAPGSDEETLLTAMRQAYFSIFQVRSVVKGVGVEVWDALRDGTVFLADVGFGGTARVGAALATRVIPMEGFVMTTGAPLPVSRSAMEQVIAFIEEEDARPEDFRAMPRQVWADMAGLVIGVCLANSGDVHMTYLDPGEDVNEALQRAREDSLSSSDSEDDADDEMEYVGSGEEDPVTAPIHAGEQIGRNDPCPCGSGRKFKKCCGR
jgi:hypothetical protein